MEGVGRVRRVGLLRRLWGRFLLMQHPNYHQFKQYLCNPFTGR